MRYHEVARRLENLESGFGDVTQSLDQIQRDLKLVAPQKVPDHSPCVEKFSTSGAIVSEVSALMREAANPDAILVATQLAKIGGQIRLCLPGGAFLSREETVWMENPKNGEAPPDLFYLLAQEQLLSWEKMSFSYDVEAGSSLSESQLRANLARELEEEISPAAVKVIDIRGFLPSSRRTVLASMRLPSADASREIARRLEHQGVSIDEQGHLRNVYTVVTERVALAHAQLDVVEKAARENPEALGIRSVPLGDLLELAKKTSESVATFARYKAYHVDRYGSDGLRGPSTTWALGLLSRWIKDFVLSSDAYREGPRAARNSQE